MNNAGGKYKYWDLNIASYLFLITMDTVVNHVEGKMAFPNLNMITDSLSPWIRL